jgi:hypothetical protein
MTNLQPMPPTSPIQTYWNSNITDNALCYSSECYGDLTGYKRTRIEGNGLLII